MSQHVLFSFTMDICRAQFELRNADAHANVAIIRDKYLRDAKGARPGTVEQDYYADCAAALTELIEKYKDKNFEHQRGVATPESRVRGRSRETTVERLVRKGGLEARHGAAALEIARIYQAIIAALDTRAHHLDGTKVDGGAPWDPSRMADWLADKHLHVYRPWCAVVVRWKRGPRLVPMLQDVICLGIPLDTARRRWRFNYKTAFEALRDALDLFADIDEAYTPPEEDDDPAVGVSPPSR